MITGKDVLESLKYEENHPFYEDFFHRQNMFKFARMLDPDETWNNLFVVDFITLADWSLLTAYVSIDDNIQINIEILKALRKHNPVLDLYINLLLEHYDVFLLTAVTFPQYILQFQHLIRVLAQDGLTSQPVRYLARGVGKKLPVPPGAMELIAPHIALINDPTNPIPSRPKYSLELITKEMARKVVPNLVQTTVKVGAVVLEYAEALALDPNATFVNDTTSTTIIPATDSSSSSTTTITARRRQVSDESATGPIAKRRLSNDEGLKANNNQQLTIQNEEDGGIMFTGVVGGPPTSSSSRTTTPPQPPHTITNLGATPSTIVFAEEGRRRTTGCDDEYCLPQKLNNYTVWNFKLLYYLLISQLNDEPDVLKLFEQQAQAQIRTLPVIGQKLLPIMDYSLTRLKLGQVSSIPDTIIDILKWFDENSKKIETMSDKEFRRELTNIIKILNIAK